MDISVIVDLFDFLAVEELELQLEIEKELQIINLEQQIDILASF